VKEGESDPRTGKEPIGQGWGRDRITIDGIGSRFRSFPGANVGACLGPGRGPDGVWLADFEGDGDRAEDSFLDLTQGEDPPTPSWTSSRGKHRLFEVDQELLELLIQAGAVEGKGGSSGVYKLPQFLHLEIRIGGTKPDGTVKQLQSVAPPSATLIKGGDMAPAREWIHGPDTPLAAVPDGVYRVLRRIIAEKAERSTEALTVKPGAAKPASSSAIERYARKALEDEIHRIESAPEGQRNDALNESAFSLGTLVGAGALHRSEVEAAAAVAGRRAGLGEGEVRATVRSGIDAGILQPRDLSHIGNGRNGKANPSSNGSHSHGGVDGKAKDNITPLDRECAAQPLSDTGNAHRLILRYGSKLRYCHPWNKWLVWDKRRWRMDNTGAIYRFAMATALSIKKEASVKDEKRAIREHVEWGNMSEGRSRIEAMLALARSLQDVPILPEELDRDRWLLNVQNGTLDLKTSELRPHRREDLLTSLAPVEYDPDATCPLWDGTLNLFLAGDREMIQFWQRLCGRCLTGDISEQIRPILYGTGGNGKSTILATLYGMLGTDYALMAPPGLLLQKNNETHPTDRASLFGKRLVIDIESAEDARLNENFVKQLTGSDPLTVRRMREDFWSFDPTHKLLLATNHKPVIKETKDAIWRRIKLIPFTVKVPKTQENINVPELLKAEYSGILSWCLRGLADWQHNGLQCPDKVEIATKKYRDDEDTLARFLAEECIVAEGASVRFKVLYERYHRWTEGLGETPKSQKFVGEVLTEKEYEKYTNNGTCYRGIGLVANPKYDATDPYNM
jgi:P4 family phage/plasmid primase-like protien